MWLNRRPTFVAWADDGVRFSNEAKGRRPRVNGAGGL
jgi:hypothetical protein